MYYNHVKVYTRQFISPLVAVVVFYNYFFVIFLVLIARKQCLFFWMCVTVDYLYTTEYQFSLTGTVEFWSVRRKVFRILSYTHFCYAQY